MHRVVLAAEGEGSARRLADVLVGEGVDARVDAPILPGTVTVLVAPLERGVIVAGAHLALVAEADLTGRRRVHRTSRGARKAVDYYDDLKPGDFVVHQVHGVGRYEGMVARAIGGVERDYLLLAYRGGDKLYVPTDQVGTVRRYTGGDSPSLSRMGGDRVAEDPQQGARRGARDRGRAGDPLPQATGDTGLRVRARHAVAARARGRVPARGDARPAPCHRRGQDRHGGEPCRWTGSSAATSGSARPRWRCGPRSRRCRTASRSRSSAPTTLLANQHGQTFRERFAGYPVRVEVISRFLTTSEQNAVVAGHEIG